MYFLNEGTFIFIIGLTRVKIEQDYCAWERSLNPSSTAINGWCGLSSPSPTTTHLHPHCPILSPTMAIHAQAPLPSPEGCGPVSVMLDGGELRGWEEQGQESRRYEVHHENRPQLSSWPVFTVLFSQLQCLMPLTPALCQPHDNERRRTPRYTTLWQWEEANTKVG